MFSVIAKHRSVHLRFLSDRTLPPIRMQNVEAISTHVRILSVRRKDSYAADGRDDLDVTETSDLTIGYRRGVR